MRAITYICMVIGCILIVGAVGGYDVESMNVAQMLWRCGAGLLFVGVGLYTVHDDERRRQYRAYTHAKKYYGR